MLLPACDGPCAVCAETRPIAPRIVCTVVQKASPLARAECNATEELRCPDDARAGSSQVRAT